MLRKMLSFAMVFVLMVTFAACSGKGNESSLDESATTTTMDTQDSQSGGETTDTNTSDPASSGESSDSSGTGSVTSKSNNTSSTTKSSAKTTTGNGGQTTTTGAVTIPDQVIYIFGGESNENRAKLKTMGQQSWYPMYSTSINVDVASKSYPLNTLKPCKLTVSGLWKPNETVTDNEGNTLSGTYFSIRKDGFVVGDTKFTAALKWVCEYDGTYNILISYSGGSSPGYPTEGRYEGTGESRYYIPPADGVYLSAYIKNTKVIGVDSWTQTGKRIEQTEKTFNNQKLKKGDTIVIVSDTKDNGGWDDPWWYVSAERIGN